MMTNASHTARVMLVVDQLGTIWRSQQSDEVSGPTAGSSSHGSFEGRTTLLRHWCYNYVGGV